MIKSITLINPISVKTKNGKIIFKEFRQSNNKFITDIDQISDELFEIEIETGSLYYIPIQNVAGWEERL